MDNQKRIALEPNMGEITNTSARLSNEATKTPRTDAELKLEAFFDGAGIVETVLVEFAEQLETELAEARAEIERLKSEHEDSLRRAKDNAVSLSGTVTEYAAELLAKDKLIEQMKNCYNCKFELHAAKECETCNTADCDDSYLYETSNWQPKEPEAAEGGE